jgi:hypothetical protein
VEAAPTGKDFRVAIPLRGGCANGLAYGFAKAARRRRFDASSGGMGAVAGCGFGGWESGLLAMGLLSSPFSSFIPCWR